MHGVGIERSELATCCGGTYFDVKVSDEYSPEEVVNFHYQVDSTVSIDYIPVLVFVTFDLQLQLFFDIAIKTFHLQLEFALMKEFQRIVVAILKMDFELNQ